MTDNQWNDLLEIIDGRIFSPLPSGFIIDSPWLPGWSGDTILDYFTSDAVWFESNQKAVETFPECLFLPGFWSEYGMCSEPSAFGSVPVFTENGFPHAKPCLNSIEEADRLRTPDPATDGLAPFLLNRLKALNGKIEATGHRIRFSVSRGPLNIAAHLLGTPEFLLSMKMNPERAHRLLRTVTDYLAGWHRLQASTFPHIDGMLILDDLIGFIGEDDFREFGMPYFRELFSRDVRVRFLHNDARCEASLPHLADLGINLFNMAFDTNLNDLKGATGNSIVMLGNIPPRDVLAGGSPEEVKKAVRNLIGTLKNRSRVILSCGGGMPPGVTTENIRAFLEAVHESG
ncbi:uroporphyrinogen decarboxylase [bacterium]|nr:uroporphyrinogen decarboxylase [bacterium]